MTTTAPARLPDATRCPQCRGQLSGPASCPSCGLVLTGPAAVRLWEVDVELLRLDAARTSLLSERADLLAQLRGEPGGAPVSTVPAPPVATPRPEWTPQRVQNALLGLGGLLLAVAALVFTAVTYDRLGAGGRAAVLATLTAAAALAVPRALRRGLTSTAETLSVVALVLAALDAYGLRTLGVGDGLSGPVFAAVSAGALALLAAAGAALVPVRLPRVAAVLLAQLPVPLLLVEAQPSAATTATVLAGLAAADLAGIALLRSRFRELRLVAALCAATVTVLAVLLAAVALVAQPGAGALALLACAAVVAAAAALAVAPAARLVLSAVPVGLAALAALGAARPELSDLQLPLVPAAVAVVAVLAAVQLPRALRPGPVTGAVVVAAVAALAVAEHAVTGLLDPLSWALEPWTLADGTGARAALSPLGAWRGSLVTPVVLAAAAAAVGGAGLALRRAAQAAVPAGVLAVAALSLLPVGLDLPYPLALAVLVVAGAAAVLVPVPDRTALPARLAGAAVLLLAVAWSLADRTPTLVVLPAAAALLATVRVPRLAVPATAAAGLLAAGELAAVGAAADLARDQVGALLVVAVGALVALAAPALGRDRRAGSEAAAGLVGAAAISLTSVDPGWLSWTLAGLALVALAGALRADRRRLAGAGGLLLAASSWVRLADAGVTDPEPYVLPLAAVALVLGHLRRRREPRTRSFAAYGPGLSALLLPSLLASYAGSPLWRPLLLAGVALVVVLLGVRDRLQAPLAIGGAVLAADAVLLLAPYAAALPRWLVLGAAGALLVAVGATYERRRRDLVVLRGRYDALG